MRECRLSRRVLASPEAAEKFLGSLIQDTEDLDYSCIVLGRDRVGRYRAVEVMPFSTQCKKPAKLCLLSWRLGQQETRLNMNRVMSRDERSISLHQSGLWRACIPWFVAWN